MTVTLQPVGPREFELEFTDELRAWQRKAHEFAEDVVRPVGELLDRMSAADAVAPGSPVFEFIAQAHREGYTRLTEPPEIGGRGLSRLAEYVVFEELSAADAGLTSVLLLAALPFRWSRAVGGSPGARELATQYFSGRSSWIGCYAVSGWVRGPRAALVGGDWRLNGTLTRVPNAAVATHALVSCTVAQGSDGLAIVALDGPGVRRQPILGRLGLRALSQAHIVLHDVTVPGALMRVARPGAPAPDGGVRGFTHAAGALLALGISRAAYEGALRWAGEHERDGRVLLEHETVRLELFRVFTLLQALHATARSTYISSSGEIGAAVADSIERARAALAFATETASEIADRVMALCGARAADNDGLEFLDGSTFHPEKLLRDAQAYKVAAASEPLAAFDAAQH